MPSHRLSSRTIAGAALVAAGVIGASGCSVLQSNDTAKTAGNKIAVTSTDSECQVSVTKATAGNLVFNVTNKGTKVTEFYLYGEDNLRIVGEIENIGPGLSRQLVVAAPQGKYHTACKPGMVGQGIRAAFIVDKGAKGAGQIKGVSQQTIDQATGQYAAFVKDQTQQLVAKAAEFTTAYKAGEDAKARALFPMARTHWEAVEPVAESFGDLDPKTDLREADLEPGQKWTGWHRIEKDLWPPSGYTRLTAAQRATYADDLTKNIATLNTRVQTLTYTVDQIANGSKSLLDEVASGKITGEEDTWSHTDLYDFQANVTGAKIGYDVLKPLLQIKDPTLSTTIGQRFTALQTLLDQYKKGNGFVSYDTVDETQRKELSDAVNALAEPLSQMTGAITL